MADELKDILEISRREKVETAATVEYSAIEASRRAIMSGPNLKDVVIGAVDGPQLPARFDPSGRIFYPKFVFKD